MTHELQKTLAFVLVAVLLTGAAFVNIPDRSGKDSAFEELGRPFFPGFTDPNACTNLEVVDYNPETATVSPFNVMLKDGKWTIPSHYDYPADAKDRLAKTASGVTDLTKDTLRSDRMEDHETLGVVDPRDEKVTTLKGQGKRVTLKDTSGRVLADFIIGNEVKDRPGMRYVRVPGQKRTYGVNVKADLSTRFADWIETNLLKVEPGKVRKVAFDSHKVDPDRRRAIPGEVITIDRKDASAPWNPVGIVPPPGKELDTEKLFALNSGLGDVKIAGVRPKPEGLSRDLMTNGDVTQATRPAFLSLISKGFYPVEGGKLLSNEGDVVVSTEEGAAYTLRFGGVFVGGGEALSAGSNDAKAGASASASTEKKDETKKDKKPGETESRYLMVTVAFDPTLLPPLPDPDEGKPLDLPADVFHHETGSPERLADEKAAKEKADAKKAASDKRVAEAEAKVKALSERFARWYYLTPTESFKALALDRSTLFRDKSAKPPGDGPDGPPGGFPGFPGGFPGGGPGGPGGGRPINPHGPG